MLPKELRLIYKILVFFGLFAVLGYGGMYPAFFAAYYLGDYGEVGSAFGYFILYRPLNILLAFLISLAMTRLVKKPTD